MKPVDEGQIRVGDWLTLETSDSLSLCGGSLIVINLLDTEFLYLEKKTRGQFYKSFTLVIYKCSYCFQQGSQ